MASISTTPSDCEVDLFLIGKTGHGKSSTGNTILGREAFLTSDLGQSAELRTNVAWARLGDIIIKVVDGPGLVNTRLNKDDQLKQIYRELSQGFVYCPDGFRALLLVMKYASRYTDEEQATVDILRQLFGKSFVRNHCILVLTYGEDFDLQGRRNPGMTLETWCQNQTGAYRELIEECGNKVVLFYNLTEEKRAESVNKLLFLVETIQDRYTHTIFDSVKKEREKLIQKNDAIQLKENIAPRLSLMIGNLDSVTQLDGTKSDVLNDIKRYESDALDLKREIEQEDKHSEVVQALNAEIGLVLEQFEKLKEIIQLEQEKKLDQGEAKRQRDDVNKQCRKGRRKLQSFVENDRQLLSVIWRIIGDFIAHVIVHAGRGIIRAVMSELRD